MIGFIFFGIPLICIIALIIMGCSGAGSSKGKGTYFFIHDEDGEIVDSYLDRSIPPHIASDEDDDFDDYPGCIRMGDGSIMVTDDDDYMDEFGEDMLYFFK